MHTYEPVSTPRDGLRLHLNENTAGCSPAVQAAIHALSRQAVSSYPDYAAARAACAQRLGVNAERLLLTNGLDEGILGLTGTALKGATSSEVIILVPAFDMYAAAADGLGASVVQVPLAEDFAFPHDRLLAALTPRTRLVWLTNPNNPSGRIIPREAILAVADAAPQALVAVDEAYADFSGETLLGSDAFETRNNLVVGRTFSKAYGLAGLRVGALIGNAALLAAVGRIVPPYSINACAAAALPAALADTGYYDWYRAEVEQSRRLLYVTFDRLGVTYWPSQANFVLVRPAGDCAALVRALAARGIHVRDRSRDTHSVNCFRVTAGVVADTAAFITAFEEVLCGAA